MKQDKIAKEREEQRKLRERIANMTEEEKQQYEADKIEAAIQDKKKGKHLKALARSSGGKKKNDNHRSCNNRCRRQGHCCFL